MIDKELLEQKKKELFDIIDEILDSDDHDAKMKCIGWMLDRLPPKEYWNNI